MSDILVIKITFGTLLTLGGVVLLFLAFKLYYKYLIQEERCTSKVKGTVKRYTICSLGGEDSGVHLPVVYYVVNGKEYKVIGPEYKNYVTKTKSSPFEDNSMKYKEDNQTLEVIRTSNAFLNVYVNPISKLYPINSEIDVYYDPNNPKLSYVLRYCNRKWIFWLVLGAGILVLIADLLMLLML